MLNILKLYRFFIVLFVLLMFSGCAVHPLQQMIQNNRLDEALRLYESSNLTAEERSKLGNELKMLANHVNKRRSSAITKALKDLSGMIQQWPESVALWRKIPSRLDEYEALITSYNSVRLTRDPAFRLPEATQLDKKLQSFRAKIASEAKTHFKAFNLGSGVDFFKNYPTKIDSAAFAKQETDAIGRTFLKTSASQLRRAYDTYLTSAPLISQLASVAYASQQLQRAGDNWQIHHFISAFQNTHQAGLDLKPEWLVKKHLNQLRLLLNQAQPRTIRSFYLDVGPTQSIPVANLSGLYFQAQLQIQVAKGKETLAHILDAAETTIADGMPLVIADYAQQNANTLRKQIKVASLNDIYRYYRTVGSTPAIPGEYVGEIYFNRQLDKVRRGKSPTLGHIITTTQAVRDAGIPIKLDAFVEINAELIQNGLEKADQTTIKDYNNFVGPTPTINAVELGQAYNQAFLRKATRRKSSYLTPLSLTHVLDSSQAISQAGINWNFLQWMVTSQTDELVALMRNGRTEAIRRYMSIVGETKEIPLLYIGASYSEAYLRETVPNPDNVMLSDVLASTTAVQGAGIPWDHLEWLVTNETDWLLDLLNKAKSNAILAYHKSKGHLTQITHDQIGDAYFYALLREKSPNRIPDLSHVIDASDMARQKDFGEHLAKRGKVAMFHIPPHETSQPSIRLMQGIRSLTPTSLTYHDFERKIERSNDHYLVVVNTSKRKITRKFLKKQIAHSTFKEGTTQEINPKHQTAQILYEDAKGEESDAKDKVRRLEYDLKDSKNTMNRLITDEGVDNPATKRAIEAVNYAKTKLDDALKNARQKKKNAKKLRAEFIKTPSTLTKPIIKGYSYFLRHYNVLRELDVPFYVVDLRKRTFSPLRLTPEKKEETFILPHRIYAEDDQHMNIMKSHDTVAQLLDFQNETLEIGVDELLDYYAKNPPLRPTPLTEEEANFLDAVSKENEVKPTPIEAKLPPGDPRIHSSQATIQSQDLE